MRDHDPAELAILRQRELQISSSYSHSDGASFGALRISTDYDLGTVIMEVSGQDLTYFR